ncbi:MAG: thioredoxin [Planctomycetota bacterium]
MASTSPWVVDVDDSTFASQVIERSSEVPVLVDFWADWCQPCRLLAPVLEQVTDRANGAFVLAKVDTEKYPQLAQQFGIHSLPTVKAFRDGQVVDEFAGLLQEEEIQRFVDGLAPNESDLAVKAARDLESKGDLAGAEAAYRRALAEDAGRLDAQIGLARVQIASGQTDEAKGTLAAILPDDEHRTEVDRLNATLGLAELAVGLDPEAALRERAESSAEARFELGCLLAARGQHEESLQTLLSAAEEDKTLAREKVKDAMVKIFYAIGVRSELADDYRTRLSRTLY